MAKTIGFEISVLLKYKPRYIEGKAIINIIKKTAILRVDADRLFNFFTT